MSVTKILDHKNLNLLQQVEMRLCHVYFHRTLQYHVVICACILHHFMKLEDIARTAYVKTLAYTTELLLNIKGPRDLNYIQSK